MDDDLRAAERAWRADPDDPLAHERWIEARLRAGIAVDHEELEGRLHPARELRLPVEASLHLQRPDGSSWSGEAQPGQALAVPPGRHFWIKPPPDPASVAALTAAGLPAGTGLSLELKQATAIDPLLEALRGARWTHLKLSGLPLPSTSALRQVAALPGLLSLDLGLRSPTGQRRAVTRDDLHPLASARGLTSLVFNCRDADFEPGAVGAAAGPALRALRVWTRGMGAPLLADEELIELARAAPDLRHLELGLADPRQYGDAGVAALARHCPRLTVLSLPRCPALTDVGVAALAGLPLRELTLAAPRITDAAAPILAALPLERLDLNVGALSPDALWTICSRSIELQLSNVRLVHLPAVSACRDRLVHLSLRLDDGGDVRHLRHMTTLSGLRTLGIAYATDMPLPDLSACHQLTDLTLWNPGLRSAEARQLCQLQLESLAIWRTPSTALNQRVDADALQTLATHPTLECFRLHACSTLTDEVLLAFAATPKLARLALWECTGVTQAGVDALRAATHGRLEVVFD